MPNATIGSARARRRARRVGCFMVWFSRCAAHSSANRPARASAASAKALRPISGFTGDEVRYSTPMPIGAFNSLNASASLPTTP